MSEKLFSQKIKYLNEKLNLTEREFTKLFWDGNPKTLSSRNMTVHKSWLGSKGIYQVKGFYFDEYEISKLTIDNNELAFTKESFMVDSFEEFKSRVDTYVNYKKQPQVLFEYRYIYYFDVNLNKISYAELKPIKKINGGYKVELIPAKFYKDKGVEIYVGALKIDKDYFHISVENSFETLTFYFMLSKGYSHNNKINGIGLGLSYDRGLPLSTKNLLTKEKLTKEEKLDFYLNANESEYLITDERFDNLYTDVKTNYLNKFYHKLENLTTFMNTSRKEVLHNELAEDIYLNIFYKSFIGLNEISKKVMRDHNYFISRRRMATEVFLKSISINKNSSCRIVYPLFKGDTTLFDKQDERAKKSLNLNIKLAKNGLNIERIFIIDKSYKFSIYLKKSIKLLIESGITVKIALVEDLEGFNISSYDFVYSQKHSVAIYKNTRDRICLFKVTKVKDRVKQLSYDYDKIDEVSFSFEKLLLKQNIKSDKVLEKLIGTWHYYFYGSIIENKNEFILWHNEIKISTNGSVTYAFKNKVILIGNIDTVYNKHQSVINLNSLGSSNLSIITINKKNIYKNIFKVTMIDKQFGTDYDMATFGIFSRKELDENLVKKALGNIDEVMLRESMELEKRINELYIEGRF